MGLFGKNKNKEFEMGHNDALFDENDDYVSPLRRTDRSHVASHALTVDEVSGTENIPMKSGDRPQSGSVYESMKQNQKKTDNAAFDDNYVPSWATSKSDTQGMSSFFERQRIEMTEEEAAAAASRAEEILKKTNERTETPEPIIPIDTGTRVDLTPAPTVDSSEAVPASYSAAAFLERCKMVVNGNHPEEVKPEPIIMEPPLLSQTKSEPQKIEEERLEAEEEKLEETPALEEDDVKVAEPKAREVSVSVEVIPPTAPSEVMQTVTDTQKAAEIPATDDTVIMPPVTPKAAEASVSDETVVMPPIAPLVPEATVIMPPVVAPDVKVYGRVVHGKVIQQTPEGDIEVSELIKAQKEEEKRKKAEEMDSTRMFAGLDDIISQKADDSFNSSRELYDGDIDDSEEEAEELEYYESEDDTINVDEYKDLNDAARLRTDAARRISVGNIKTAASFIVFVLILLLSLPIMDLMPEKAKGIISIILTAVSIGVNYDIFKEFKNIAGKMSFDASVALASVVALVQTGISAFKFDGSYPYLAAAAVFLIAVNSFVKVGKEKRLAKGLEIIGTSEPKKAIKIADEKYVKTMASGLVEGEVIGLCGTETVNLQNFVKNSSYKSPFDLKAKVLFFVGLGVSLAVGVLGGLLGGLGLGITLAAAVMLCCYPAAAVISAEMPMNRIANMLFDKGTVVAGFKGAYDINLSNVVAINTSDLFPEGTVKLYNMKTLGENELGPTLTAAAAVAIAAKSPLAGIFRDMVGVSDDSLPRVNGVQYEDKMGISGWIGDNTVLIGNRNLMQAHGVPVPPAAVDQKILKAGYFPVYIACKGVPCLLFIVKYETDPEVARELKKLCDTGMTVLVNPQDPNASDAMICDYFGIPDDALKIMKHNGRVVYERDTAPRESVSAPALYGKDITGFFKAVTKSINLNAIIALLTAIYIISSVLGTILLVYLAIMSKLTIINAFIVTAYQIIFMFISLIAMKVKDK